MTTQRIVKGLRARRKLSEELSGDVHVRQVIHLQPWHHKKGDYTPHPRAVFIDHMSVACSGQLQGQGRGGLVSGSGFS